MAKKRRNRSVKKNNGKKVGAGIGIGLLLIIGVGVALYFGVPEVKDFINGLFVK